MPVAVSIPFNPIFNPKIIDDGDIKGSKRRTDKSDKSTPEKERVGRKVSGINARPPPSPKRLDSSKKTNKGSKQGKPVKKKKKTQLVNLVKGLSNLKRRDISELKSFKTPSATVKEVVKAIVR